MDVINTSRYCWVIGNTGFRESALYEKIESYLLLLKRFNEEGLTWRSHQLRFFEMMQEAGLMEHGSTSSRNAPKAARLKTSPLEKLGLVDELRALTPVGSLLIKRLTDQKKKKRQVNYLENDGDLYMEQLLKFQFHANREEELGVRPFVLTLRAMRHFGYLTRTELGFLLPLMITKSMEETCIQVIEDYRKAREVPEFDDEKWLMQHIIQHKNQLSQIVSIKDYLHEQMAIIGQGFEDNNRNIMEEVAILMDANGKSKEYSLKLVPLFEGLYGLWSDLKYDRDPKHNIEKTLEGTLKVSATQGKAWRQWLFGITNKGTMKHLDQEKELSYIQQFRSLVYAEDLEDFFLNILDLLWYIKIMNNLTDYEDHNTRYFKLAGIFETVYPQGEKSLKILDFYHLLVDRILEDSNLTMVHFDKEVYKDYLYNITYQLPHLSEEDLEQISYEFVNTKEMAQVKGIGEKPEGMNPKEWLMELMTLYRLHKIRAMVEEMKRAVQENRKDNILKLLSLIEKRDDRRLRELMDTEAEVPTIFEYLLWQAFLIFGDYVDDPTTYANFSLDHDLKPVQHAGGGQADVIYTYKDHDLLLEATLTKEENQRKLEMEPVPRHLAKYRADYRDMTYCIFVAPHIDPNVAVVHRQYRQLPYYVRRGDEMIEVRDLTILPLAIEELKGLLEYSVKNGVGYDMIRQSLFKPLIRHEESNGYEWYEGYIKKEVSSLLM